MPLRYFNSSLIACFIRSPKSTGSLISSSPRLSRHLASIIQEPTSTAIELGPGRGPITKEVLKRTQNLICYEKSAVLAQHIQSKYPNAKVKNEDALGCVEDIKQIHQNGESCCIVSSLPFTLMDKAYVRQLIAAVAHELQPAEQLSCFFYIPTIFLPQNRWIIQLFKLHFSKVQYRLELFNAPPALILICTK